MPDPRSPEDAARALLPLVRRFAEGRYGIALGGSLAKSGGDAWSDLDVYLFAERIAPGEARTAMAAEMPGATEVASWGAGGPEDEGGTDFVLDGRPVEVWIRPIRAVEDEIARARRGEIRREYRAWTVMGFFGHAVLSDVASMRVIEDPAGVLAGWQREMRAYPPALREAIVSRYLAEAGFWRNFHYETAVERADVLYASGIVHHAVYALLQVVFALNGAYFPGEKRLARALDRLPRQPDRFVSRVESLVHPAAPPTVETLRAQARELKALIGEVEQLARDAENV